MPPLDHIVEKTEERVPSWGNAGMSGGQCGVTVGPVRSLHEDWNPGRDSSVASTENTGLVPGREARNTLINAAPGHTRHMEK